MKKNDLLIRPLKLEALRKQLEQKVRVQEELNLVKKNNFFTKFKKFLGLK